MFNRLTELRDKRNRGEGGFTLIELLVVVVILGILIAIAIPLYLNYKKGANDKAAQSDMRGAISALETCVSDNSKYPSAPANLKGTLTGCSQTISQSSDTTLKYFPNPALNAYLVVGTNSSGNMTGGKSGFYCYASTAGGSVSKVTGVDEPAAYADSCPASA